MSLHAELDIYISRGWMQIVAGLTTALGIGPGKYHRNPCCYRFWSCTWFQPQYNWWIRLQGISNYYDQVEDMLYLKPTKMKTKSQTWSSWVLYCTMNNIYLQMLSPIWYCTYQSWSFGNDDDSHLLHHGCMRTSQSSHCGTWSSLTATYVSSPICVYSRNTCK